MSTFRTTHYAAEYYSFIAAYITAKRPTLCATQYATNNAAFSAAFFSSVWPAFYSTECTT